VRDVLAPPRPAQLTKRGNRGLTDAELWALHAYRTSGLFSDLDTLVLEYAAGMSRTPGEPPMGSSRNCASTSTNPRAIDQTA
jgi:hypothetical protein